MSKKAKNIASLILNAFIFVNVIYCILWFYIGGGQGNMLVSGSKCFMFYTIDSNVLCALSCLVVMFYNIKALKTGELELPKGAVIFKFCGTVAVTVTLIVVVIFLGPTQGYPKMFTGTNIFMHLINGIAALLSFLVFEKGFGLSKKEALWGDASVVVYGTLYLIMVIIVKKWQDFYGFATVLKWYISYPGMILFGLFLSLLIRRIYDSKK